MRPRISAGPPRPGRAWLDNATHHEGDERDPGPPRLGADRRPAGSAARGRVAAGPKPALVAALGATYHRGPVRDLRPDVILECAGAGELVPELAGRLAQAGVLCLIGISSSQRRLPVDLNRVAASMVLENAVIFGTVSAARRHYEQAVEALTRADPAWLGGLITRRVPLSSWQEVLTRQPGDVKVTVDLTK